MAIQEQGQTAEIEIKPLSFIHRIGGVEFHVGQKDGIITVSAVEPTPQQGPSQATKVAKLLGTLIEQAIEADASNLSYQNAGHVEFTLTKPKREAVSPASRANRPTAPAGFLLNQSVELKRPVFERTPLSARDLSQFLATVSERFPTEASIKNPLERFAEKLIRQSNALSYEELLERARHQQQETKKLITKESVDIATRLTPVVVRTLATHAIVPDNWSNAQYQVFFSLIDSYGSASEDVKKDREALTERLVSGLHNTFSELGVECFGNEAQLLADLNINIGKAVPQGRSAA